MKRGTDDDVGHESKRLKVTDSDDADLFDPALERQATDIYEHGTDGSGFLFAKTFMTWSIIRNKLRLNVQVTDKNDKKCRFDVEFSGACADFFDKQHLHFGSSDEFLLALKGVKVEKKQKSSSPHSLPITLKYTEGVVVQFTKSQQWGEDVRKVDVWELRAAAKAEEEDWFTTPRDPPPAISPPSLASNKPAPIAIDAKEAEEPPNPTPKPVHLVQDQSSRPSPIASSGSVRSNNVTGSSSHSPEPVSARPVHRSPPSRALASPNHASSTNHTPTSRNLSPIPVIEPVIQNKTIHPAIQASPKWSPIPASSPKPDPSVQADRKPESSRTTPLPTIVPAQPTRTPTPAHSPQPVAPPAKKTKKQAKQERRKARRRESASALAHTAKANVEQAPSALVQLPTPNRDSASVHTTPSTSRHSSTSESRNSALDFKAGFRTELGELYTPLNSLVADRFYNVIGVVISINEPKRSSRNDWTRTVKILDSSKYNADPNNTYMAEGIGINCFTKNYKEWLPSANCGDVLVVRQMKAASWTGNVSGVGYSDKLRWAIYTPSSGKVHHGELGSVPRVEALADGFGHTFTPFWDPGERELAYCSQLADWWREVVKKREEAKGLGTVHQIGGEVYGWNGSQGRKHRLICEAGPDVPPNGFFDCTIEVLFGHLNDNGVYSLYVTDYTTNQAITPVQGDWCPRGLADRVLKVEMWEAAADIGKNMVAGEYYSMRNNRMRLSRGGYVEGTISDAKIHKLDESDAGIGSHLQALLDRKKSWENDTSALGGSGPAFEHKLIKDIVEGAFFSCTVEILHTIYDGNGLSYLYITDYTSHPDLSSTWPDNPWSRGLEGRIVKVLLGDGQIDMAKSVDPGSFYSIHNLRLKKSTTGKEFQGRLGGTERLIHKLKTHDTTNEDLKALIRRKEEWEVLRNGLEDTKPLIQQLESTSSKRRHYSTIKDILASEKSPNKYRIIARVVRFYPMHIHDFVVLHCSKCDNDIPNTRKACIDCDDIDHEYVQHQYRFFLQLEDKEGTNIQISVCDECPLLEGLESTDLRNDPSALQELSQRLEPIIGNLVEVHEGISREERVKPDTPWLSFIINLWDSPMRTGLRVYGLADCDTVL